MVILTANCKLRWAGGLGEGCWLHMDYSSSSLCHVSQEKTQIYVWSEIISPPSSKLPFHTDKCGGGSMLPPRNGCGNSRLTKTSLTSVALHHIIIIWQFLQFPHLDLNMVFSVGFKVWIRCILTIDHQDKQQAHGHIGGGGRGGGHCPADHGRLSSSHILKDSLWKNWQG